ncbi:hypothetical protein HELRODRAFT_89594, partial [Helobdella robusta]|uniref:RRM domain-containing protein n=1 Tax=Helobdella robusta TaxID=6412 RepID=T1G7E8_HELRO
KSKSMKKVASPDNRGVILVRHIPHGFYEPQMKKYFEQFGEVTKLRLLRSNKTGRSKGSAFVEFENDEVARIVSDAMKDYLMFRRRVMC